MSDVFENRLTTSYGNLMKLFPDDVDVPEDRKFVGFDGYKKAIDCLNPGDVVIFATPPAFRWVHFGYAIQKGVQCLHGEAGNRRRTDHPQDDRTRRGGHQEEPQGGRRPDDPPLPGPDGS